MAQSAHMLIKPCSVVVVVVRGLAKKCNVRKKRMAMKFDLEKKCSIGCSNRRI